MQYHRHSLPCLVHVLISVRRVFWILVVIAVVTPTIAANTQPALTNSRGLLLLAVPSQGASSRRLNNRRRNNDNDNRSSRRGRFFDLNYSHGQQPSSYISTATPNAKKPRKNSSSSIEKSSPLYFLKVALSGGIAGAVASASLFPMDSAKTLRQTNPSTYKNTFVALKALISSPSGVRRVYKGVLPGTLGAIPSSALYFGAYESSKTILMRKFQGDEGSSQRKRLLIHALAAMSGNVLSSAVFVPKELIKQQLQYEGGNLQQVCLGILQRKGLGGFYVGFKATLLRNIPAAVLRFCLYEELKHICITDEEDSGKKKWWKQQQPFLAGAIAGAVSSGAMTPVDVLKTRLATGTCPVDIPNCFWHVVRTEGVTGLYSGAGSRVIWSGAFSAIGFGTFENVKKILGVGSINTATPEKPRDV